MSRLAPRTPAPPANYDAYASDIDVSGSLITGVMGQSHLESMHPIARVSGRLVQQTPGGISVLDDLEGNSPVRPPPMMQSQALDQIAMRNSVSAARPKIGQGLHAEATPYSEAQTIKPQVDEDNDVERRDSLTENDRTGGSSKPGWMNSMLQEAWTTPSQDLSHRDVRSQGSEGKFLTPGPPNDISLPSLPSEESSLVQAQVDQAREELSHQSPHLAEQENELANPYPTDTFIINAAAGEPEISPWKKFGNGGAVQDIFREPVQNPDRLAGSLPKADDPQDILADFESDGEKEDLVESRRLNGDRHGGTVEMTDLPDVSMSYSQHDYQNDVAPRRSDEGRAASSHIGDTWLHSAPNSLAREQAFRTSQITNLEAADRQKRVADITGSSRLFMSDDEASGDVAAADANDGQPPQLTKPQRTFTTAQVTWRKGGKVPETIGITHDAPGNGPDIEVQERQARGRLMLERMKEGLPLSSHDEVASEDSDEGTKESKIDKVMHAQPKVENRSYGLSASRNGPALPSLSATFRSDPLDSNRTGQRLDRDIPVPLAKAELQTRSVSDPARNRVQNAREFMKGLREKMMAMDRTDDHVVPNDLIETTLGQNEQIGSEEAASATAQIHRPNTIHDQEEEKDDMGIALKGPSTLSGQPSHHMKTIKPDSVNRARQIGQMIFDEAQKKWYKIPTAREISSFNNVSALASAPIEPAESSTDAFDDSVSDVRSSSGSQRTGNANETLQIWGHPVLQSAHNPSSVVLSIHPDSSVSQRVSRTPADIAAASGVNTSPSGNRTYQTKGDLPRRPLGNISIKCNNVNAQIGLSSPQVKPSIDFAKKVLPDRAVVQAQALQVAVPQDVLRSSNTPTPLSGRPRPAIRLVQNESPLQQARPGGGTPRSVSFSDGRKTGRKIKGLEHVPHRRRLFQEIAKDHSSITDEHNSDQLLSTLHAGEVRTPSPGSAEDPGLSFTKPSVRTIRMENALQSLESLQLQPFPITPLGGMREEDCPDLPVSETSDGDIVPDEREFSTRRLSIVTMADLHQTPARWGYKAGPDASHTRQTMLTNWDFSLAQDRLVECIARFEPYEPYWEHLRSLNLSNQGLESLIRFKEYLPRLEEINLSGNRLEYLSGLPKSISKLVVRNNLLDGVTSFEHLPNLRYLDISYNQCDSLLGVRSLPHLQHLCADYNQVSNLDAVSQLKALCRLSLRHNALEAVDFADCRLENLEILNLSSNQIKKIDNLDLLRSLIFLNIDDNALEHFELVRPLASVKTLRVNRNLIQRIHLDSLPNLRRLYADENALEALDGEEQVSHLEQLSVRDQKTAVFRLHLEKFSDLRKLWLSGNPYQTCWFFSCHLLNLQLLEINHCQITDLPADLNASLPNLRILHAQSNFIKDVRCLKDIERLYKLDLIGNQLRNIAEISGVLERLPALQDLDIRWNPITLALYPSMLLASGKQRVTTNSQENDAIDNSHENRIQLEWLKADERHCRGLNDRWSQRRLYYRGMCLEACPLLKSLDGIAVLSEELDVTKRYLENLVRRQLADQTRGFNNPIAEMPKRRPRESAVFGHGTAAMLHV